MADDHTYLMQDLMNNTKRASLESSASAVNLANVVSHKANPFNEAKIPDVADADSQDSQTSVSTHNKGDGTSENPAFHVEEQAVTNGEGEHSVCHLYLLVLWPTLGCC